MSPPQTQCSTAEDGVTIDTNVGKKRKWETLLKRNYSGRDQL